MIHSTFHRGLFTLGLSLVLTCFNPLFAEEPVLQKGDRLAVIGDSITEQKLYSNFIETYLQACYPELEIQCFQFGWGGERAPGFVARMENDLVPWNPDVVTTCYGMNDGSYRAYTPDIGTTYEKGMRQIIERMIKAGATVVVGTPGVVDSFTWQQGNPDFDQVYNENLGQLGEIDEKLAAEYKQPYADVFEAMMQTMIAAKAKLGENYPVAGGDGVHPGPNGHLVMAYAFLKALGLDGKIGTITVDMKTGRAEATDGHKILGANGGAVDIESSRYPFCFSGDEKSPNGTRSILPYVPFNEDLNRFILVVNNLETPNADVTFGPQTRTYSKEQLAVGINLAAEFTDNPFVSQFNAVQGAVGSKQGFETSMIKGLITNFRSFDSLRADDPEFSGALDLIRKKMTSQNDKAHAEVRAKVVPVKYSLKVTPKV